MFRKESVTWAEQLVTTQNSKYKNIFREEQGYWNSSKNAERVNSS
jgi:hypothetical protein